MLRQSPAGTTLFRQIYDALGAILQNLGSRKERLQDCGLFTCTRPSELRASRRVSSLITALQWLTCTTKFEQTSAAVS